MKYAQRKGGIITRDLNPPKESLHYKDKVKTNTNLITKTSPSIISSNNEGYNTTHSSCIKTPEIRDTETLTDDKNVDTPLKLHAIDTKNIEEVKVREWLSKKGYVSYIDKILALGGDRIDRLKYLDSKDLNNIGMKKIHQKEFLYNVNQINL